MCFRHFYTANKGRITDTSKQAPNKAKGPRLSEQNSKLLQLPAELRNRIYELVLVSAQSVLLGEKPEHLLWPIPNNHPRALLCTCCQVQFEGAPIYYSENVFATSFLGLKDWLRKIGVRNREFLSEVRLPSPRGPSPPGYEWRTRLEYCHNCLVRNHVGLSPKVLRIPSGSLWVSLHDLDTRVDQSEDKDGVRK